LRSPDPEAIWVDRRDSESIVTHSGRLAH
jgi:hypothetical protein